MKKQLALLATLAIMTGCSQHHMAAEIGPYQVHVVQPWHVIAPSSTETFTYDTRSQNLSQVNNGIGGGVLSIAAMPIATVTAAHELADGIGRSGDTISTTNSTSSLSEGSNAEGGKATGGDSVALGGDSSARSEAAAVASSVSHSQVDNRNTVTNSNQNSTRIELPKPQPNHGHGKR